MALPIKTTSEDVEAIVSYLRTKATGATIAEARAAVGGTIVDGRKLTAYRLWGFVVNDNDRLKLTSRGREFARASEEKKQSIYADVIREQRPYVLAMEWAFHQGFEELIITDLAAHWHEHARAEIETDNETTIREQVACFFNVAQAANLGTYVVGRSGSPTRLTINRDSLGQFIGETGLIEGSGEGEEESNPEESLDESVLTSEDKPSKNLAVVAGKETSSKEPLAYTQPQAEKIKVFISHSKNMDIVEQIKTMIELADIEHEVAVEEETAAIPVPEKVLAAMRRCNAAVICVTADEQARKEDGKFSVNENVLIEIGAAFVLYDKRVVLVWDRRIPVPSNLQGLYRCEFEGNELSWSSGMKLMKAVKTFKVKGQ